MKRKKCTQCKAPKSVADGFYTGMSQCKECHKSNVKARYREKLAENHAYEKKRNKNPARRKAMLVYQQTRREAHPDRYKARTAVGNALRDRRLFRQPCEACGGKAQAHHDDYSKPLDVRWLCFRHHREHHGQQAG